MVAVASPRKKFTGIRGYAAVLCTAFVAFLLVRLAPPKLPEISLAQTAIISHSAHDHRQCFDHDELGWGIPLCAVAIGASKITPYVAPATELFLPFPTKGPHYNRPPPLI